MGRFRLLCCTYSDLLFWLIAFVFLGLSPSPAGAQRVMLTVRTPAATSQAGTVPGSQPITLILRLTMSAEEQSKLDAVLAEQTTVGSPSFHHWLSPMEFGEQFGATDDQIAEVSAWVNSQGLNVDSVSASRMRITISGSAARVQSAFAVSLSMYEISGSLYIASSNQPSLPQSIAGMISGIEGLSQIPDASPLTIVSRTISSGTAANLAIGSYGLLAEAIDENASSIVPISTAACSTDFIASDYIAYEDLFRQANAQGMTILATSGCGARGTGSFPASLPEVTALTVDPSAAPFLAIAARPGWQSAPGLPADDSRHEADLTTTSLGSFTQAISTIVQQNGTRQGNINSVLYELAPTKGLYTRPDATAETPSGTWEPATGLGLVDLSILVKAYPRDTSVLGTITSTPVASSPSSPYGQPFTLSVTVAPSGTSATSQPSGTVSFMSGGVNIGSVALNNGTATLNVTSLSVGSYIITASYSGDANYAASTSPGSASVTVTIVNASLMATIAPTGQVPYGATATVTATVALPNSSGSPVGTVSAQVEGVTGALSTATLSPNPGGNSATANIVVAAPVPGSYTVQVACAGNQNFQCQTPVNITPFTTVKGYTLTSLVVSPAVPQAGLPTALTATISNAGNGTGTYTFTGTISFFDNGKLLSTAAVGTNQATATVTLFGNVVHAITATYSGDVDWNGSSSAAQSVTTSLLPSTIVVSSNVSSSSGAQAGLNVVLTATVSSAITASAGPSSTVTFWDTFNGKVVDLGSATLVANGAEQSIAVLSTTNLLAGTHDISAAYSGDSIYQSSTSAVLPVTLSDFTVTMVPTTLTVTQGQSGQVSMLVGAISGFTGSVTFGCTPSPSADMTCSFSPTIVNGAGSTTMTVTTFGSSASSSIEKIKSGAGTTTGLLCGIILCFLPDRRRVLPRLLLLLGAIGLTSIVGCAVGPVTAIASGGGSASDPGSPLGTQIVTVTAAGTTAAGTVRHTYQYQVTVQ